MKIAIIGYGRMGHIIEQTAIERGHRITCVIDAGEQDKFSSPEFRAADVAIEFSVPSSAVENILSSFSAGVPVVCGTTGWLDDMPQIRELCEAGKGTLLYGSNFSVGVNIFMAVNRYLARLMEDFEQYSPLLTETHHIHKLDHPSGTAITLADDLVKCVSRLSGWMEPAPGRFAGYDQLPVEHVRRGEVPGIHTIEWNSPVDTITITHSAKSRDGFALGAVMAAEWLKGRHGFFSVGDMLSDITATKGVF